MATPILYIGLGSSGLAMLEEAQRFHYSTGRTSSPEHTRFLFIETDANKKRSNIPGQPPGRNSIEAFPTVLSGVGVYRSEFERRATVRLQRGVEIPSDAVVVLELKDRQAERVVLDGSAFPEDLYTLKPTVFSRMSRTLTDQVFRLLNEWIQNLGLSAGKIAVRKVRDRFELYLPKEIPEKIALRIEVLFNEIELSTRLVKRRASADEESATEIEAVCWLPPHDILTSVGDDGAGGMRNVGRIALWRPSHLMTGGSNLSNLKDKVSDLANQLRAACGGQMPVVYIVGTFAGGTNSGMFIDVAYLCREAIDPQRAFNPDVLGLFLLPKPDEEEVAFTANAYASLRDLAHFSSRESQFLAQWPRSEGVSLAPFEQGSSPFKLVTLMSSSWVMGGDLSKLTRMAGLFLYLMGTDFVTYRKARAVDPPVGGGNITPWKFSAVGLTGYFFPRGEVRVSAACRVAVEEVFEALVSRENCRVEDGRKPLAEALSIRRTKFLPKVEEALERCFDHIASSGPGGKDFLAGVRDFLAKVDKKGESYSRSNVEAYLAAGGEIYKLARPAASQAVTDILLTEVNRIVAEEINATGNLRHGVAVAVEIAEHLLRVGGFWGTLQLERWDAALQGTGEAMSEPILDQVHDDRHGWALSRSRLRRSRFEDALRLMSIHALAPHVATLATELRQGSTEHEDGLKYPQLLGAARIGRLVGMTEDAAGRVKGYAETIAEGIAHGIHPNDPFRYIFPLGGFAEEVDEAVRAFKVAGTTDARAITGVDENGDPRPLLQALQRFDNDYTKVADEAVAGITKLLENANLPQIPAGKSLEEIVGRNGVQNLANMAVQNKSVSVRQGKQLVTTARHPRIVVCETGNKAASIHADHQLVNFDYDLNRSQASSSEALKDMVVFFDEAQLHDLSDLAAYERWKPGYDQNCTLGTLDAYLLT